MSNQPPEDNNEESDDDSTCYKGPRVDYNLPPKKRPKWTHCKSNRKSKQLQELHAQRLLDAAYHDNYNLIFNVLEGEDNKERVLGLNETNIHWMTVLHVACRHSTRRDIVDFLIKKGADINLQDYRNRTPLHLACVSGFEGAVELLLEKGAQILRDSNRRTPLHLACQRGHTCCAAHLLAWTSSLQEQGSISTFPLSIYDLPVNDKDRANGDTPLHLACKLQSSCPSLLELLVRFGAGIGIKNKEGMSPLHTACSSGHSRTVLYLLDIGSKAAAENSPPLVPEHDSDYSLICLDSFSDSEFFHHHSFQTKLCSDWNNIIQAQDSNGDTALHQASAHCNTDVVLQLLDLGIPVNGQNNLGETPLYKALNTGNVDSAIVLLDRQADPTSTNQANTTLLQVAAERNLVEVVWLILRGHPSSLEANSVAVY